MKKIFSYLLGFMFSSIALVPMHNVLVSAESSGDWFDTKDAISDEYVYSFAIVGDTQSLSEYNKDHMHTMYQWIIDNKEKYNTQFVFGLGDITEGDVDWEWENNKSAISKLDGVLPYSLIRGNHDTSEKFYKTFGNEIYMDQFLGFYKENNLNSCYRTLTVGKTNFLLLTLDYGADDNELIWAGNIIEKYSNHKVIISTHAYLNGDETILDKSDSISPSLDNDDDKYAYPDKKYNTGTDMWDKLISNYGNIVLVMSGHVSTNDIGVLQSVGIHGNTVTQMVVNPQDLDKTLRDEQGCGMVCMAHFNADFTKMEVEYYSTVKEKYYKEENQKEIDISSWGSKAHNLKTYYNDYFHWQECDCGRKMVENLTEHEFEFECSAKCKGCDYTRETNHDFKAIGYDESGHYKICSICAEKNLSTRKDHIYDGICDSSCNECDYIRSVSHTHLDKLYTDVNSHWYECEVCHMQIDKQVHIYDNDCDTTCNICGFERYTYHDYSILKNEGNKYWKECSVCGDIIEITYVKSNKSRNIIIFSSIGGFAVLVGVSLLILKLKVKK